MFNFRSLSNTFPYDFMKFSFSRFITQVWLFFIQKRKPKIFEFKNAMEKGIRKILTFLKR